MHIYIYTYIYSYVHICRNVEILHWNVQGGILRHLTTSQRVMSLRPQERHWNTETSEINLRRQRWMSWHVRHVKHVKWDMRHGGNVSMSLRPKERHWDIARERHVSLDLSLDVSHVSHVSRHWCLTWDTLRHLKRETHQVIHVWWDMRHETWDMNECVSHEWLDVMSDETSMWDTISVFIKIFMSHVRHIETSQGRDTSRHSCLTISVFMRTLRHLRRGRHIETLMSDVRHNLGVYQAIHVSPHVSLSCDVSMRCLTSDINVLTHETRQVRDRETRVSLLRCLNVSPWDAVTCLVAT